MVMGGAPAGTAAPPRQGARLAYLPALDGIRAVAVLVIIAFHTGIPGIPGGYFSVDAFFTLSGYLITSLLVVEWGRTGTVSLRGFWARRARRLLAALFVMLAVVGLLAAALPSVLGSPQLLGDGLATVFYVANWHLIAEHADYFVATGRLSPLLHTWTLAIEEQFYLIWPLVVVAVLGRTPRPLGAPTRGPALAGPAPVRPGPSAKRHRRLQVLLVVAVMGALASAVEMALVTHAGGDPTRSYYGSDTRAQSLLVGAALAVATALWGPAQRPAARRLLWLAGWAGAGGTALLWATVPETSRLAFHGGFLLAATATAAVIAAAAQLPRSPLARVLGLAPLRYLGQISYGMYLWYWPTVLVLTPDRTHLPQFPLLAVRVAVVVALATVSAFVVELPIRRGALPRWRAAMAAPLGAMGALCAIVLPAVVAPASAAASLAPPPTAAPSAGPPVKILLVGDSIAGSLGVGMGEVAPRYGAEVVDEGSPGCSVSMDQLFKVLWFTVPPGAPCVAGDPGALLAQWQTWVQHWNPDVVVYLARGELFDQEHDSTWTHLGRSSFDAYVTDRFRQAVAVLGAQGAHVVLLTTPYYDSGGPDGRTWPEDQPRRVVTDNALIERVAAQDAPTLTVDQGMAATDRARPGPGAGGPGGLPPAAGEAVAPGGVSVIDLGSMLSPGRAFAAVVDGVTVRCPDGVHISAAGGRWAAARLLPRLVAFGRAHQHTAPGGSWPGPLPADPPAWWNKLHCGIG